MDPCVTASNHMSPISLTACGEKLNSHVKLLFEN